MVLAVRTRPRVSNLISGIKSHYFNTRLQHLSNKLTAWKVCKYECMCVCVFACCLCAAVSLLNAEMSAISVWTSPRALSLCCGWPNRWICIVWHLVDEHTDSSAWYCNLLLPILILFCLPNLSTKLHKGAFVSLVEIAPCGNDAFVLTTQCRNIAYLSAGEEVKDFAENTKPPIWRHEAFWGCCF